MGITKGSVLLDEDAFDVLAIPDSIYSIVDTDGQYSGKTENGLRIKTIKD